MSKLPMDVMADIFSHLLMKPLVRFKALSKPYCSLIDDPDFIHDHLGRSLNIILKGLHLYSVEFKMKNMIVGFDLGIEEFIQVPQLDCADKSYLLDVGVLEGRLYDVCNYDQAQIDVWVMKEYEVKESWTPLLSVQRTRTITTLAFLKPLAYSKDLDKVLMEINSQKFVWYDLEKKKMWGVKIGGSLGTFGAEVYIGSLV